ncbi:MAG TPA: hypothetical protein GXZ97_00985, partial [Hydrogenispora sp.]|nr:hypothetical protein [Hydrogenispora sp.]
MFDRNGKISALPWKIGAFFGLLFFILLLLVLTPEKVCAYETPAGYDAFDYQKLLAFLELPNGTGKNGHLISAGYNPADPTTWEGVTWSSVGKVTRIDWPGKELVGDLDLSGCTALQSLYCYNNALTSLDVSGCTSLMWLK